MIGPRVLKEHPAYSRTLGAIQFAVLAASSRAPLKSRYNLAGRSSNEVLVFTECSGSNPHRP